MTRRSARTLLSSSSCLRPRWRERAAEPAELAARSRLDSDVATDVHKFMDQANQHPMGRFYGV